MQRAWKWIWIELDSAPGGKQDLQNGLRRCGNVDEQNKAWQAVVALPMKSLAERFEVPTAWRANFFRGEGASEPGFYSAWRPTNTPQPNFHVPEAFGGLVFTEAGGKIGSYGRGGFFRMLAALSRGGM